MALVAAMAEMALIVVVDEMVPDVLYDDRHVSVV